MRTSVEKSKLFARTYAPQQKPMSLQVHVMVLGTVERAGKPIVFVHEEKVFWLRHFFGGIATILPLFILTSELIAISTSFRCLYLSDPRPCCSKFVKALCRRKWTAVGVAAVVSWMGIGLGA